MEQNLKKQTKSSNFQRYMGIILVAIVWLFLSGAGFWYARQHMDQAIKSIHETNSLNVQLLEEKINSLGLEINAIQEALAQTDETLSGATSVSEELNKRITELDQQLSQLERSLKILEESENADY